MLLLAGCATAPADRYHRTLDPLVGQGKKADVIAQYGQPTFCGPAYKGETCEYLLNGPGIKPPGDTIHLYFDQTGVLAGWEPLSLPR